MNEIFSNPVNVIVVVIVTIVMILAFICVRIAARIQKDQKKRYAELKQIVSENKDITFQYKDSLTQEDIDKVEDGILINELMKELYDTYLTFEEKLKKYDTELDDVLTGFLKEFYINKINNFKNNGYADVNDGISLIGYSISEFNKNKLKFKISVNCYNYKMINKKIVSGSDRIKVTQIVLLTYEKKNGKWLISAYDKIYEKILSN